MFLSAIQWSESAICIYINISPPSWASLPPHPSPPNPYPTPLGHLRAPSWTPWAIQCVPNNDVLHMVSFPADSVGKESACNEGFNPWVREIPWRRNWQPTPVFLPGKSHRQRSLVGYSPWGRKSWTWLSD